MFEGWGGKVPVQDAPGRGVHGAAPFHPNDAIREDGESRLARGHYGLGIWRGVVLPFRDGHRCAEEEEGRKSQQKQHCSHLLASPASGPIT